MKLTHFLTGRIIGLLLLFFTSATAFGQSEMPDFGTKQQSSLPFTYWHDASGQITARELQIEQFIPANETPFVIRKGNYWLQFELSNEQEESREFVLDAGNWAYLTLFEVKENETVQLKTTGKLLPQDERPLPYSRPLLPLTLKAGEKKTLLLQLSSSLQLFRPEQLTIKVNHKSEFIRLNEQRLISQGIFGGIILVMVLYNFLIYLTVNNRSYLYYVLSIIGICLYLQFFYGFTFEYYWPSSPFFDALFFSLSVPFTGLFRILFTQSYLATGKHLPLWHKVLNGFAVLYFVPVVMGLFTYLGWYDYSKILVPVIGTIGNVVLALVILVSIFSLKKQQKVALIFLLANISFVAGAMLFNFREMGWLEDNFFTRYIVQVGTIMQLILFSLGLGYRLNKARQETLEQKIATERMRIEQEIERMQLINKQKEMLEQQVNQRTMALNTKTEELRHSIAQLTESENELRRLNRIKDKLFSVISHDLRSPLATLNSFLNIMAKRAGQLSEEQFSLLMHNTNQSLRNLSVLLDNLLQWSRSQMQAIEVNKETINIKELVEKNVQLFHFHAENKQISLREEVPAFFVSADRNMLDFVLRNLINNALKFTPKYGSVSIQAKEKENKLQIAIRDTGIGMSEVQQRNLEKFEGSISTVGTDKEKGTGLGLLLCEEFIRKLGSELVIESEEGKGSCFIFEIDCVNDTVKGEIYN